MTLLTSMKMTAEETKEQNAPSEKDAPKYPWGLQIHLDDKMLKKLGISEVKVGSTVMIVAQADCTSCSSYQTQGGDSEGSCDLQITDMQISTGKSTADVLYGK